jgi:ribosomal protein S27AE
MSRGQAPVCSECGKGAMLPEVYAEAAQSDDGSRVAVVKNVPRLRCAVCGYHELEPLVAVLVGGLLGGALTRNQVTVFDWEKASHG